MRAGSIVVTGVLMAVFASAPLHASSMASASISGNVCNLSQTVTGILSAAASLSCSGGSAQASGSFNVALPALDNLSFADSAAPFNVSNSGTSFDYLLYITGGTGTGFLALDYVNSVFGSNDPQASASSSFATVVNGVATDSGVLCSSKPAVGGPFSCSNSIPIGFGFTYGTPFELAFSVTAVAGGGLGGSQISGTGSFSYAILSGSLPNPNARLNLVPEPASTSLAALALAVLAAERARKRRHNGRFDYSRRSPIKH